MHNVYLYIRPASDQRARDDDYDRQLKYARKYCPTLIEDSEHIFFGREDLRRFCDAVAAGKVAPGSTLLVEDLTHLSRDQMRKASDKLLDLAEHGIVVVTTARRRAAGGYASRYQKAREGAKVKVLLPGWVEWLSATEYRLKPAEAAVVRRIFEMVAAGASYGTVVKTLNQEGVEPFRSRGKGKLWITATIFGIVTSQAAIGVYAPRDGGPPLEDYFPAVVSKQLFQAVQDLRATRAKGQVSRAGAKVNLWSKVGSCGVCGRPLHLRGKGEKDLRYLVCSGKGAIGCKALNINADKAEVVFLELLANVVHADCFGGGATPAGAERQQVAMQLLDQQAIKASLVALLSVDPLPEVVAAIKKAKLAIARLEAARAELERAAARTRDVRDSHAALMETIDLGCDGGRAQANALLRRLKIKVALLRTAQRTIYRVEQDNQPVLQLFDSAGKVIVVPYRRNAVAHAHGLEPSVKVEDSLVDA